MEQQVNDATIVEQLIAITGSQPINTAYDENQQLISLDLISMQLSHLPAEILPASVWTALRSR